MNLQTELAPRHKTGLLVRNPVLLAAGTAGYGYASSRIIGLHRLGALVSGSVSLHAHPGPEPWQPQILETPSGLLSAFRRPDPGVQRVRKLATRIWSSWQTPVIVSLAGTSLSEFASLAASLDGVAGVSAFELNLASANLETDGAIFGADADAVEQLIRTVRQHTVLPLIAKLAPYDGDLFPIALAAAAAGVDAISLIHTLPALQIDIHTRRPALYGGLSGPAIRPLALRMVYDLARELRPLYPHVPLIGIGGITSSDDALTFLMAGATAIQVGSINFVNPWAAEEIVTGIETFLQREGVEQISELVGVALSV
jgi:dihydroorotate dehydrogenase (NAD+) catalytic subunit